MCRARPGRMGAKRQGSSALAGVPRRERSATESCVYFPMGAWAGGRQLGREGGVDLGVTEDHSGAGPSNRATSALK